MAKTPTFGMDVQAISDQVNEMVGKFKMPGIDAQALVEQQRKNIDAVVETMRIANVGTHTIAERQLALFHDASTRLLTMFTEQKLTSDERATLARQTFETALAGSREVYDITAKAMEQAYDFARQRVAEGVEAFRKHHDRKVAEK